MPLGFGQKGESAAVEDLGCVVTQNQNWER
jgi:hypothetical protein